MKMIGIVAEYNPFHNGHGHHIVKSRESAGGDSAVICVMSGDFVQRGEASIFSKHARAEAAVIGGADLVIELPPPWSLSSAEGFARGAVGLLGQLGCIDYLSFGSECGDMKTLNALATAIMDPALNAVIKRELETGVSYASARQRAVESEYGSIGGYLSYPNNILAVEYLKAIYELRLRIEPLTVQREGTDHDGPEGSASDIRARIKNRSSYSTLMPRSVRAVYKREMKCGRGPVDMLKLEEAFISRFRMLDRDAFNSLPDAGEGLGNRLYAAAREEYTLDGILSAAKTKRYALSRIRRMCVCAALGIAAEDSAELPPYARVLAANEKGCKALRTISEKSSIPVITKPASVNGLSAECRRLFEQTSGAHDLYVLGYGVRAERRGGADYRTSPIII